MGLLKRQCQAQHCSAGAADTSCDTGPHGPRHQQRRRSSGPSAGARRMQHPRGAQREFRTPASDHSGWPGSLAAHPRDDRESAPNERAGDGEEEQDGEDQDGCHGSRVIPKISHVHLFILPRMRKMIYMIDVRKLEILRELDRCGTIAATAAGGAPDTVGGVPAVGRAVPGGRHPDAGAGRPPGAADRGRATAAQPRPPDLHPPRARRVRPGRVPPRGRRHRAAGHLQLRRQGALRSR